MRLENKSVVVTGVSAGMGRAIAKLFVREGANVIGVARRKERLDQLAEELKTLPGTFVPFCGDITKPEDAEGMIAAATERFGRLDVLVNNAGIMDDISPLADMTDELYERLILVNLTAPVKLMRKALRVFLKQGDGGNIINVTSVGAEHETSGAAYCAAKAGLAAAARNVTFMYKDQKIRCNCIAPGGISTEIATSMGRPNMTGYGKVSALTKLMPGLGQPEDIAAAALFLASDESGYVNGMTLTVDGGWTCL